MSQATENLGLYLEDSGKIRFKEWREKINGPVNSNMVKIDDAISQKQNQLTGNQGQVVGFDANGAAVALTVTAGDNIRLNQTDGELKIGVSLDNGTIEGSISLLDDLNKQGTYNWLDTNGEMGYRGGLWNVSVSNSAYRGVHPSVTQTLLGTYGKGTKGRVFTRAFYYVNSPQWTPWRELVSLDQASGTNLLDNWYFPRPVNQRGAEVYRDRSGQFVYTVDRFQMYNGEMSLTAGGLKLTGASPESYTVIRQLVLAEYNPNLIFSAIINGSLYSCAMDARTAVANVGTLACEHSGTNAIVSFICTGEAVVFAAKLELGTVQTLAHQDADGTWVLNDPPPDPALELVKCQRYFVRRGHLQSSILGVGAATGNNEVTMSLPIGPMRANVAATVDNLSDIKITETDLVHGISPTELRTVGPDSLGNLSVFFTLGNNTVTQGKAYKIGMTGGGISFSADL